VYYVNSANSGASDTAGRGNKPSVPFATIDFAIGQCTANQGDVIIVMPNHAETVTGTSAITFDVAGISIVGLGHYNQRPRVLMDGAATVKNVVSAADVRIENIVFAAGHADVAVCFSVTGKGCWLNEVEFDDNTTAENYLNPINAGSTDNTADGLRVTGCRWLSVDAACTDFVTVANNIHDMVVNDNYIVHEGTASQLISSSAGAIFQQCEIMRNFIVHKNKGGVEHLLDNNVSTNSGIIAHNRVGHDDTSTAHDLGIDGLGCRLFDNLSVSTGSLSGFVLPAIDVDT
jgi:hypothetical protein